MTETTLRFDNEGKPIIQGKLTRLSSDMAQNLINECMAMPIDVLKLAVDRIDETQWEDWERDQCEHERTIMVNILVHRLNQGECDGIPA